MHQVTAINIAAMILGAACFERDIYEIIGGNPAIIEEHPYQVAIMYNQVYFCGGAILTRDTILTSAYCAKAGDPFVKKSIIAGSSNITEGGVSIDIESYVVHENYDANSGQNDIALIKLVNKLQWSDYVYPVELPEIHTELLDGAFVNVTGYGVFAAESYTNSDILRKAELKIVEKCNEMYTPYNVTKDMICTLNNGTVPAVGDWGCPLVRNSVLHGLVSWVFYDIYDNQYPTIYTNVASYIDWIKENY